MFLPIFSDILKNQLVIPEELDPNTHNWGLERKPKSSFSTNLGFVFDTLNSYPRAVPSLAHENVRGELIPWEDRGGLLPPSLMALRNSQHGEQGHKAE